MQLRPFFGRESFGHRDRHGSPALLRFLRRDERPPEERSLKCVTYASGTNCHPSVRSGQVENGGGGELHWKPLLSTRNLLILHSDRYAENAGFATPSYVEFTSGGRKSAAAGVERLKHNWLCDAPVRPGEPVREGATKVLAREKTGIPNARSRSSSLTALGQMTIYRYSLGRLSASGSAVSAFRGKPLWSLRPSGVWPFSCVGRS